MRLHRLTLSAVGPFSDEVTIDFDQLSDSGRFLLTGPTGSGKSTLIDAIVFALYGEVAGAKDSSKDRMRSRHAAATQESVVDLSFSTSAGSYRVRRTPAYERPKLRGTGMTQQKASVRLWKLTDPDGSDEVEVAVRPDEAGAELTRAIGLTREQFTQTVVLPQGKFASFLRATSEERHELLRGVFGTALYDQLQDRLRQAAASARRDADALRTSLQEATSVFIESLSANLTSDSSPAQETGGALPEETSISTTIPSADRLSDSSPSTERPADESAASQTTPPASLGQRLLDAVSSTLPDDAALQAALGEVATQHKQAVAVARERSTKSSEAAAQARATLSAEEELAKHLSERATLLTRRSELADTANEAAHKEAALEAAERAAGVAVFVEQAQDARTEAERALAERGQPSSHETVLSLKELQAALEAELPAEEQGWHKALPLNAADYEDMRAYSRTNYDQAAALQELVTIEEELPERRRALSRHEEELDHWRAELAEVTRDLLSAPQRKAELESELIRVQTIAAGLPALRLGVEKTAQTLAAAQEAERLKPAVDKASETEAAAARQAAADNDAAHALRQQWIDATAASLAADLREDAPCPVCGSHEHPEPAITGGEAVSQEALHAAEDQARASMEALQAAREALSEARSKRAHAAELSGGVEVVDAASAADTATTELAQAEAETSALAELKAQVAAWDEATEELRARQLELSHAEAAGAQTLQEHQKALEEDIKRLVEGRAEFDSIAKRRSELLARATAAEASARAIEQRARLVLQAAAATARMRQALVEANFVNQEGLSDLTVWRESMRSSKERQQLRRELEARRVQETELRAGLERPEIARLTGDEQPQVEEAREREQAAQAAWQEAEQALGEATMRAARSREDAERIRRLSAELTAAAGQNAALIEVAALANGDNPQAIPLATWVLIERFKEMLVFANARLETMSSGRYELVSVQDEKQSARKRGLGVGVIDRLVSEQPRDPKTLSGGETFYVSLALALALADVVAAESGGTMLDTLFIDEGFGSLDPETLEKVLAELTRLQDGGRVVGIVSHVEELRRQIPDQIRVASSPQGSTLSVQTA